MVEILWWLVPPVVVTLVAMVWVSWLGRDGRGEIDRDEAVARLGRALDKPADARRQAVVNARPQHPRERSTGIAVRPSKARQLNEQAARNTRRSA